MLTKATRSSCNILQQRLKNPKHTSESTLGASKPATPSRLTYGFVFCLRAKGKVRAWSKPRIFFLSLFGLLLPWLCVPSLTPFDYYNSLVLPVLTTPTTTTTATTTTTIYCYLISVAIGVQAVLQRILDWQLSAYSAWDLADPHECIYKGPYRRDSRKP